MQPKTSTIGPFSPSRHLANSHCRSMRNELQCGDKLVPSPRSIILGVWLGNTLHWRVSCLSSWRCTNLEHPCSSHGYRDTRPSMAIACGFSAKLTRAKTVSSGASQVFFTHRGGWQSRERDFAQPPVCSFEENLFFFHLEREN